jgi:2TM domain
MVQMPAEATTEHERQAPQPEVLEPKGNDTLRALAIERIYRLRRFKLHLAVFAVGIPLLGCLWVLTEYFEEDTWPSRFASDPDVAGTWDPWLFFVAGIWLIVLAIHGLRTYFGPAVGPVGRYIRRPISETEVEREVERLKARA